MNSTEGKNRKIETMNKPNTKKFQSTKTADIAAIIGSYHGAPHTILGPHTIIQKGQTTTVVRAFRPLDSQVWLLNLADGSRHAMSLIHKAGFFELTMANESADLLRYRLIVQGGDGHQYELEDPYAFPPMLTEYDLHLHGQGNFQQSYEKLGAQVRTLEYAIGDANVTGINFAVWAPNAQRVSVIGPFNDWDNRTHAMQRRAESGIWEIFIPNLPQGAEYKYSIRSTELGYEIDKADPYAFYADLRPNTSSRVWQLEGYEWQDEAWLPINWWIMLRRWAILTSSFCQSPSIPMMVRGAIRWQAILRPPAAMEHPTILCIL